MNENNTRRLGMVNIILILIAIVAQLVVVIRTDSGLMAIAAIICIVALLYAGFYAVSGYKKSAAYLFKIFYLLFAIAEIGSIINIISLNNAGAISGGEFVVGLIAGILAIAAAIVLGFIPNLGHEKSRTIAEVLCAIFAIMFVLEIAIYSDPTNIATHFPNICRVFGGLVLALLSWLMVYEKYKDKFIRKGTED